MLAKFLQVLSVAAFVLYPVAVFFGLRSGNLALWLGFATLFIAPALFFRIRSSAVKGRARTLVLLPLLTLSLIGLSALFQNKGLALATPTAISTVLLFVFGRTLWYGPPMVEQFARLIDPVLNEDQVRWCRQWTIIWCGFFLFNGVTAALLAALAPVLWWSLYTSLIAYVLMGTLFAIERTGRWLKFQRNDDAPSTSPPPSA